MLAWWLAMALAAAEEGPIAAEAPVWDVPVHLSVPDRSPLDIEAEPPLPEFRRRRPEVVVLRGLGIIAAGASLWLVSGMAADALADPLRR